MRKLIFYVLAFAALFVAIGYCLPTEVRIKREVTIQATSAAVYWKVSDLTQWTEWSGLVPGEAENELTYIKGEFETDSGFCWQTGGFDSQKRRLLITGTAFCDSLSTAMSFDSDNIARSCFRFQTEDGATRVSWEFSTNPGTSLLSRWKGLFIYPIVWPDMDKGLARLKKLSEPNEAETPLQLTELN